MSIQISSQMSYRNHYIEITLCARGRKIFETASLWHRRSLRLRKTRALLLKDPALEILFEDAGFALEKLGCVPSTKVHLRPAEAHAVLETIIHLAPLTKRIGGYLRVAVALLSTAIPVVPPRFSLPEIPADWLIDPPPHEIVEIYDHCRGGFEDGTFLRLNAAFALWLHLSGNARQKPIRELKAALGVMVQDLARALFALSGGIPSEGKKSGK